MSTSMIRWGNRDFFPVTTVLEEAMTDWFKLLDEWVAPVSKLPISLASSGFPPCNWYTDSDGNLYYEFAVAGIKKEEIALSLEDDMLIMKITPSAKEDARKLLQRGIKRTESESRYRIPFSKYDISKVTSKLEDGVLSVFVPTKADNRPVTLLIE